MILCVLLVCGVLLTACGQDEELTAYQEDMNTFILIQIAAAQNTALLRVSNPLTLRNLPVQN